MANHIHITYIIIGITALISFYAFKKTDVLNKLTMKPYRISKHGEHHRFITSGFIHADQMHLIVNMFSLFFFGPAVEMQFQYLFGDAGGVYFVLLYLTAIVISDIPTFLKNRNKQNYSSLGASGAIAAVVFAFIIFQPLQDLCIFYGVCMPGFILGTLYIVFSYLQGKKPHEQLRNLNHDAHLYGALYGLVFSSIIYPRALPEFIEQIANWEVLK